MEEPLLDPALADQVFSITSEAEIVDLRSMMREFETDLAPRFATLRAQGAAVAADPVESKRGLHGLRGVVANFALARAAQQLLLLETGWSGLSPGERSALLQRAEADVQGGLRALRQRFPYLV